MSVLLSDTVRAVRDTLSIMPIAIDMMSIDVPPIEMNGSGCPDTGKKPTLMAMWNSACITISTAMPITISAGKARLHR